MVYADETNKHLVVFSFFFLKFTFMSFESPECKQVEQLYNNPHDKPKLFSPKICLF